MFSDFGEFDLVGGEFGGGMEDIEVPRDAKNDMFDGETTERTALQASGDRHSLHYQTFIQDCFFFGVGEQLMLAGW